MTSEVMQIFISSEVCWGLLRKTDNQLNRRAQERSLLTDATDCWFIIEVALT